MITTTRRWLPVLTIGIRCGDLAGTAARRSRRPASARRATATPTRSRVGLSSERRQRERQRQRPDVQRAHLGEGAHRRLRWRGPSSRRARSPSRYSSGRASWEKLSRTSTSPERNSSSRNGRSSDRGQRGAAGQPGGEGQQRAPAARARGGGAREQPEGEEGDRGWEQVEVRLGMAAEELQRHDRGQPRDGQRPRASGSRAR